MDVNNNILSKENRDAYSGDKWYENSDIEEEFRYSWTSEPKPLHHALCRQPCG
jgi:hypothetical protein